MRRVFTILILIMFSGLSYAQLSWCGESYIIVDLNNSGNTWYNGSATAQASDFDGQVFNNVTSLKLGGELQSYDHSGDVATLAWAIKNTTDPSTGTVYDSGELNLPFLEITGNNDKWQEMNNLVEVIDPNKLNAGETYYLHVWFYVDDNDNGDKVYDSNNSQNYVATINIDSGLPVELIAFKALTSKSIIKLKWQTATEVNNYGFEVQRADENRNNWEKIGFVAGNGNSNSPKQYTFVDNTVTSGKYFYRLKQIDIDGSFKYSNVIEVNLNLPDKFELKQNYPNPFNPATIIKYTIPKSQQVQLTVYDVLGKEVATLVNEKQQAGLYKVLFNAESINGGLPSGIYIYKLQAGSYVQTRKMLLMK